MKKLIILLAIMVSHITFGQSIFLDQLEDMDGVSSVVVNKDAFAMLSKFKMKDSDNKKTVEIFNLIKNLDELKTYKTDDKTVARNMLQKVRFYVDGSHLKELIRVKDKGAIVKIYTRASKKKDIVNQVLMYVERADKVSKKTQFVVVSLTGKIDINKLSSIADHF